MSGHNRGKLGKAAEQVIGSGRFSGRSLAYKKGPGVPGKKAKRRYWYEGPPLIAVPNKTDVWVCTTYSTK